MARHSLEHIREQAVIIQAMQGLSPQDLEAIVLSLKVAAVATATSLPLGLMTAYILARWSGFGKTLLDALVHLPLVLPPVVTGYALLILFGRQGLLGAPLYEVFGVTFSFRWTGAALASAVMSFPLLVRPIRLALELTDPRLEQAAATLGASPLRVFTTITLPLALPGILAGGVLAFAKALGEFGATITFVSSIPGETQTIPSAIYALLQTPGGEAGALRLSLIAVAISVMALLVSEVLVRKWSRGRGVAS